MMNKSVAYIISFNVIFINLAALSLLTSSAHAAGVLSVSKEEYKEYSADNIYWEVGVRCSGDDGVRVLQQQGTGEAWCAKDAPSICNIVKESAAEQACAPAYQVEADGIKAQREAQALAKAAQEAATQSKELAAAAPAVKPEPVIVLPAKEPTPVREPTPNPFFTAVPSAYKEPSANKQPSAQENSISAKPLAQQSLSEQLTTMQALQNQIDIEEKRIQLELQKLDLRSRELELKKQELELRVNSEN